VGLFSKKDKATTGDGTRARLTDPAMLRRKGILARARILAIESKPSVGGSMADPAYHCILRLEVQLEGETPYEANVQQRIVRSSLGLLTGDDVVAPVWVDPKDRSRVAVDVAAGPVGHAPPE
jgi:hypothetical protein